MIVLCVGTEAWLRADAIRQLAGRCLGPGAASLDHVVFDAREADPAAILEAARTSPFASPMRLVVVRGPVVPTGEALDWLARYAESPTPSTCLVVEVTESPTGTLRTALHGVAQEIPCQPLKGGAAVAWVRQRMARTAGKTIAPEAAQALVARIGPDLAALAQTAEQLAVSIGPRPQVTVQDVVALVGWSVEERVFTVVDAAIREDRAAAIRVTRRLLDEDGVSPEELLGALGKHVRRLWQVVRLIQAGQSPQAAVQAAGVPWHAQAPFGALAGRTQLPVATGALEMLLETDRQLKTGGAPAGALIEPLVWQLAGPVRHSVPRGGMSNGAGVRRPR